MRTFLHPTELVKVFTSELVSIHAKQKTKKVVEEEYHSLEKTPCNCPNMGGNSDGQKSDNFGESSFVSRNRIALKADLKMTGLSMQNVVPPLDEEILNNLKKTHPHLKQYQPRVHESCAAALAYVNNKDGMLRDSEDDE